jgi:two-component system, cell cycle response regulator DivK
VRKVENNTVLIVDDHPDMRELLRYSLQLKGFTVAEATNGREAVELAPQLRPGLILMDLSMPVLDGFEATRRIHSQPAMKGIPIVAVSAFCDSHQRHKAIEAGCVECVAKPIDFKMIDKLLEIHFRGH